MSKLLSFVIYLYYQSMIIGNIEYYLTDVQACQKINVLNGWSIKSSGTIISSKFPKNAPTHSFFPYIDNGNTSTLEIKSCNQKVQVNHYLTELFIFNTSKNDTVPDWGSSMRFLLV